MRRAIAILLGLALLVSTDAVFARGGRGGAGHAGGGRGGPSMGFHGGHGGIATVGAHVGHPVGRTFVGVRHGFVGRPYPPHHHHGFGGGTVVIGAPFFYPWYPYYPYYPYYPQAYPVPYAEPQTYIEQGAGVYYYCPEYRDYYPNVSSCPSQWVPVSASASEAPR